ncbi:MAG: ABC transporter substrate-binding protein, partial [Pseudomonadota bacterium]
MITVLQASAPLADPHDCTDGKAALSLLRAFYDTLVSVAGASVRPGLAQAWTVSDDARSWRFRLREGGLFHDGTEVTAEAAAASVRRMARADRGVTLGASGVWRQYLGGAEIRAEGARALAIDLAEPVADLPDILGQGFIAAPSMLARLDAGEGAAPCGSGPYRFEEAGPEGVTARAVE